MAKIELISNAEFENAFSKAHGKVGGRTVEQVLLATFDKLEASLTEENAFGKVDKRKVGWVWENDKSRISWTVKFGVSKLQSYSAKADNLMDGFNIVREFIHGARDRNATWKDLLQKASEMRVEIRNRLGGKGGRKKKK